jgi:hypothetical protein
MIALKSRFIPKNPYEKGVRNTVCNCLRSFELQSDTYASHERFNDHALLLHAEEIRPLVELCCCGHFGEHAIERCACAR